MNTENSFQTKLSKDFKLKYQSKEMEGGKETKES